MQLEEAEKKFLENVYRKLEEDMEDLEQDVFSSPEEVFEAGVSIYSDDEKTPVLGISESEIPEGVLESLEEKDVISTGERRDQVRKPGQEIDPGEFAPSTRRTFFTVYREKLDEVLG
ncbi:MAG: hypothetical protein ABEJ69_01280 [Candidatus Nanohaloarchaea archaeon]